MIPYAQHEIDDGDVQAVVAALRSRWLTTGPVVAQFERALASTVGARHGVAVHSGTAALHAAMHALQLGPGDEVIVPAMTFAASANCVLYQQAAVRLVDVEPETLLIDPAAVHQAITPRTRAVIAVDYAGQPCRYDQLAEVCRHHRLALVADACHSLGAEYRGQPVGTLADITCFSFHPVKPITTCEGGMAVTDDASLAERMRRFRNHGMDQDQLQRAASGDWKYQIIELGYNLRLSDLQSALGLSQLRKLPAWTRRRRQIAEDYDRCLSSCGAARPLEIRPECRPARHLYPVRWNAGATGMSRDQAYTWLRSEGIGVNVHYQPLNLHPYYQRVLGVRPGMFPVAEAAFAQLLSLPLFPGLAQPHSRYVCQTLERAAGLRRHAA